MKSFFLPVFVCAFLFGSSITAHEIEHHCDTNDQCTCPNRVTGATFDGAAVCQNTSRTCVCSGENVMINGVCVRNTTQLASFQSAVKIPGLLYNQSDAALKSEVRTLAEQNAYSIVPASERNGTMVTEPVLYRAEQTFVYDTVAPVRYLDDIYDNTNAFFNNNLSSTTTQIGENLVGCAVSRCNVTNAVDAILVNSVCRPVRCREGYAIAQSTLSPAEYHCHELDEDGLSDAEIAAIAVAAFLLCLLCLLLLLCCCKGGGGKKRAAAAASTLSVMSILPEPEGYSTAPDEYMGGGGSVNVNAANGQIPPQQTVTTTTYQQSQPHYQQQYPAATTAANTTTTAAVPQQDVTYAF